MFKNSALTRSVKLAIACSTVTALSYAPVTFAQEDTSDDVEKIAVTGSRIKRTDIEGPSPITSMSAEEILGKGFVTVQDALNSLTQATGGQFDQQQNLRLYPFCIGS